MPDEEDLGLGQSAEPEPGSRAEREIEELRQAELPWRRAFQYLQLATLVVFVLAAVFGWLVPHVAQLLRRLAGT